MKTELNRARTHSARLREEAHIMRTSLEKEQQKHKKTMKELEELKSLHETLMTKGEEEKQSMQIKVEQSETTIKQLEEELLAEKSEKEIFVEETTRLRMMCDQIDEDLRNIRQSYEKAAEENKELLTELSNYKNSVLNETVCYEEMRLISRQGENKVVGKIPNVIPKSISFIEDAELEIKTRLQKSDALSAELLDETRNDLARVTKEHEDLKEKYEELERQLEDTIASVERQRSVSFHDRATSPREQKAFEFEGKQQRGYLKLIEGVLIWESWV